MKKYDIMHDKGDTEIPYESDAICNKPKQSIAYNGKQFETFDPQNHSMMEPYEQRNANKITELEMQDIKNGTPRNMKLFQDKQKKQQLKDACERVNQIVKQSVYNVSKIIERNADTQVKRSFTVAGNQNLPTNINQSSQLIPDATANDEMLFKKSEKRPNAVKYMANKKSTQKPSKAGNYSQVIEDSDQVDEDNGKRKIKEPLKRSSEKKASPESHKGSIIEPRSSKAKGISRDSDILRKSKPNNVSPKQPFLVKSLICSTESNKQREFPRYSKETLLALYKARKIRKIMKNKAIVYLISEITEVKKLLDDVSNSVEQTKLSERILRMKEDFYVRFNSIANDPNWYKGEFIKDIRCITSTGLLNEELEKINASKAEAQADDKVKWHTLMEKKAERLILKSNKNEDSTNEKTENTSEKQHVKQTKKEETKKTLLNVKKISVIEKTPEPAKQEQPKERKKAEIKKIEIVKTDSSDKISTKDTYDKHKSVEENSVDISNTSDEKIDELVSKMQEFFNGLKKGDKYQGTLATRKRLMDKGFEVHFLCRHYSGI